MLPPDSESAPQALRGRLVTPAADFPKRHVASSRRVRHSRGVTVIIGLFDGDQRDRQVQVRRRLGRLGHFMLFWLIQKCFYYSNPETWLLFP